MSRDDGGILSDYSRRTDYADTIIQGGMDHHKWDMEPPSRGMGSDPINVD